MQQNKVQSVGRINIRDKLRNIKNVPTIPKTLIRINEVFADPNASVVTIRRILEEDPPIVAKILQRINSGYYHLPNQVRNIQQAIVVLGLTETYNLVLEMSVMGLFQRVKETHYFTLDQFWKHSSGTARTALALREHLNLDLNNAEFFGGLLHDFGRLILCVYFGEEYQRVFAYAEQHGLPLLEAEKKVLNFTHTEVGFWLAKQWELPKDIREVLLNHHNVSPQDIRAHPLRTIVYLADLITNMWGFSLQPVPLLTQPTEDPVWEAMARVYPKLNSFPLDNMVSILHMPAENVDLLLDAEEKDLPVGTIQLSEMRDTITELTNNLIELSECIEPHQLTLTEALQHLNILLSTYFNFELLSIYQLDPNTGEVTLLHAHGHPGCPLDVINFRRGKGAIRWILQNKKPLLVANCLRKSKSGENPVNSFIGMPIISGNSITGVVAMGHFQPNHFGVNDSYLLEVVGSHIANLLNRFR